MLCGSAGNAPVSCAHGAERCSAIFAIDPCPPPLTAPAGQSHAECRAWRWAGPGPHSRWSPAKQHQDSSSQQMTRGAAAVRGLAKHTHRHCTPSTTSSCPQPPTHLQASHIPAQPSPALPASFHPSTCLPGTTPPAHPSTHPPREGEEGARLRGCATRHCHGLLRQLDLQDLRRGAERVPMGTWV